MWTLFVSGEQCQARPTSGNRGRHFRFHPSLNCMWYIVCSLSVAGGGGFLQARASQHERWQPKGCHCFWTEFLESRELYVDRLDSIVRSVFRSRRMLLSQTSSFMTSSSPPFSLQATSLQKVSLFTSIHNLGISLKHHSEHKIFPAIERRFQEFSAFVPRGCFKGLVFRFQKWLDFTSLG